MAGAKGAFGYPETFGWSFLALGAMLLSAHGLSALRPEIARDLVSLGILSAAVYLLFAALVIGLYGPRAGAARGRHSAAPASEGLLLAALGVRRTHVGMVGLGLALGVVVQVPADGVRRVVERFAPLSEEETLHRAAQLATETPLEGFMLVAVAACLVPAAEEIYFRGALFGALTRSGRRVWGAGLATSIVFTVSHADPRLWAPIGVVALVAGYLRVVAGSLLPCLALHVGFNSVTTLGAVTGLTRPYEEIQTPVAVVVAGWLLTAALLVTVGWLAQTSEQAAEARREDANDR